MSTAPPKPAAGHDARVDAYIARAAPFAQPVLEHLRALVHKACPDIEEGIKWGMPSFMRGGRNVAHMAAFKAHCSFLFPHGSSVVTEPLRGGMQPGMGQFGRLGSVADLPPASKLLALIKTAATLAEKGPPAKPVLAGPPLKATPSKAPTSVPADLLTALTRQPAAGKTFAALPPSHQREYVQWITEAKREATREKRLQQSLEWLAEGKRRNWKYEAC
jgi:uncharacterized protein YdeI (YjbR/CyaY-like superfamily)